MEWVGMEAFLYTEGIQLTAAHSGGRCSDLTQEEVQHLWRYNLYHHIRVSYPFCFEDCL